MSTAKVMSNYPRALVPACAVFSTLLRNQGAPWSRFDSHCSLLVPIFGLQTRPSLRTDHIPRPGLIWGLCGLTFVLVKCLSAPPADVEVVNMLQQDLFHSSHSFFKSLQRHQYNSEQLTQQTNKRNLQTSNAMQKIL